MEDTLQTFCSEFRDHMQRNGAWPPYKVLERAIGELCGPHLYNNNAYRRLKVGQLQPPKYSRAIIAVLLQNAKSPTVDFVGRTFAAFLRGCGLPVTPSTTTQDVEAVVCATTPSARDYLSIGLAAIGEVLVGDYVNNAVGACSSASDVEEAAEWIVVEAGRQVRGAELSLHEARRAGEDRMEISLGEYQRRTVSWWQFNPWTVLRARAGSEDVGVSIVLPLHKDTRDALYTGVIRSYECAEEHLQCPSLTLLLEVCCERPLDLGRSNRQPTKQLYRTVVAQCSMLARLWHAPADQPVQLIAFAANPTGFKRLSAFGFRATGHTMRDMDVPFMERSLAKDGDLQGRALRWMMCILGEAVDHPPLAAR